MGDLPMLPASVYVRDPDLHKIQLHELILEATTLESKVRKSVNAALSSPSYLRLVRTAFHRAFEAEPQLRRLDTFQDMLERDQGKLSDRVTEALLEAKPAVEGSVTAAMQELLYMPAAIGLKTLQIRISRCIAKHVIQYVEIMPLVVPSSFQFSEDSSTQQQRADLMGRLANFEKAAAQISNIEGLFKEDNYEDVVVESLLEAAKALTPADASEDKDSDVPLTEPVRVYTSAAALYDDLDDHKTGSPSFNVAAQMNADLEEIPVSPVASDLSFVNVP